jgi:hypothetical protein
MLSAAQGRKERFKPQGALGPGAVASEGTGWPWLSIQTGFHFTPLTVICAGCAKSKCSIQSRLPDSLKTSVPSPAMEGEGQMQAGGLLHRPKLGLGQGRCFVSNLRSGYGFLDK